MTFNVYPTGVTIYNHEKCWNGYTVFQASMFQSKEVGAVLIDMNGNAVKQWKGLDGIPNKMLPGGYIMGSTGLRNPKYGSQDMLDLVQVDWDGNIVWKFNKHEFIKDPWQKPVWMARQHHDYQREGNPVGYYAPEMEPLVDKGNTVLLCHRNLNKPEINEKQLLDDVIIEVNWDGEILWEWLCSDHFKELGFGEIAKNTINNNTSIRGKAWDWMHINAISLLGPNRWFDGGDKRFHPDNIIWSSRQSNITGITEKKTGKIVWKVGPDYDTTDALKKLGWIIGQHHSHMIPRGLPGEGNILIYDNGGKAGYGAPNPGSPNGVNNAIRDSSRVVEFNPVTLEIVWSYPPAQAMESIGRQTSRIYSSYISSAQRLLNGNTLITEGAGGHLIEVTPEHEIVWEYISSYFTRKTNMNRIYRAYRLPYEWIPQVEKPEEKAIPKMDIRKFRVPGSKNRKTLDITTIRN